VLRDEIRSVGLLVISIFFDHPLAHPLSAQLLAGAILGATITAAALLVAGIN